MANVEFRPIVLKTTWATRKKVYEVEQKFGFDRVMLDGDQIGLVPNDPADKNYFILHQTLSNVPVQVLDMIVANSGGRLKGYLSMPYRPDPPEEEFEDDDE